MYPSAVPVWKSTSFFPVLTCASPGVPSLALDYISQWRDLEPGSKGSEKVPKIYGRWRSIILFALYPLFNVYLFVSVTLYKICRKQKAQKESRDIEPASGPVFHIND